MSFEFLHSSQNDSTNSAIQADPSAVPARLEADVLVGLGRREPKQLRDLRPVRVVLVATHLQALG